SHQIYHIAKEGKINVIFAGHYATETVGVKAMAEFIGKKFGIETKFIDVPTGL
ncbi:MAG: Nif3-like dinuclear metal center hexameric protein, partial [Candidatus Altiarchaeales archaeon HGW-Altiarchaeales-1]